MREAEANGLTRALGTFLAINVAEPLFALGHWDESLETAERALELSPPTLHQGALRTRQGFIAAARGHAEDAVTALAQARQALADAPFEDQYHLPLEELAVRAFLLADGPDAAWAEAVRVTGRHNLSRIVPTFAWPLRGRHRACGPGGVQAAATARPGPCRRNRAALLRRLWAGKDPLAVYGPLQEAYQLTLAAQARDGHDPGGRGRPGQASRGPRGPGRGRQSLG